MMEATEEMAVVVVVVVDRQLLRGAHRLVSGIESIRGIGITDRNLLRFMLWGVWTLDDLCQSSQGGWS